jgi:hypothetical protein
MQTILEVWRDYNARRLDRPTMWSRDEVRQVTRDTMIRNINKSNAAPSNQRRPANWYGENGRNIRREFGRDFASAIRDKDYEECIDLLEATAFWAIKEYSTTDWVDLIRTKCDTDYIHSCDDCGHIDHADRGSWAYDDNWICDSCIEDNYRWSDNRETYITVDDWHEENDEQEEDEDREDYIIGDYHDSKSVVGHIPSSYDERKPRILLGMELEVEVNDEYSRTDKAQELYDSIKYTTAKDGITHQYCFIEHDGSLNRGFEIVTGYTGLDVHAKQLEFFKNPWRGVRSHDTRTCGLHVHIDKRGVSLFHACKMVFFINDSNNQKLIKDIARRANADYAQIKNKKASYQWLKQAKKSHNPLNCLNEERREALNFQNEDTIEFRLFKGTLRYETIMACLEFTYATWFFTRDTGVNELTTPNFINFICQPQNRDSTKFLRAYLKEKNYSLPKLALVKPNPRFDDYKPQPPESLAA